jgi:hypothetical protein
MTKQEFINKYKLQPGKGMGNALFDRSEEMVKDLDSLDNWIPVSEIQRRPKITEAEPGYYRMTCLIGGGEKGTRLYNQRSKSREELMIFFEEDAEMKHNGFTHWQPLPAPPQGEKGEE